MRVSRRCAIGAAMIGRVKFNAADAVFLEPFGGARASTSTGGS
jgi:hypothetical protein